MKSSLIEFSVLAGEGNIGKTSVTVAENMLALRSEVEITGGSTYSANGEGVQIDYYKDANNRVKTKKQDNTTVMWWLRSPYKDANRNFCDIMYNGTISADDATYSRAIIPFGCM